MDVIFTIVSRNYAGQAATLMRSLAAAEPEARRVVIATDGPIPQLEDLAEVVDFAVLDAPHEAMRVYYDALEFNTAVKPYAFLRLLAEPGVDSVTYLDPDIFVFRPLDRVRQGLAKAELVLTPHLTKPLLGDALPNDHAILKSGVYNLGFASVRRTPKVFALMSWWADRCRFDCRVDLKDGLFTDQRWMDLSPGFVDTFEIVRDPGLNLAYWNLEGRHLAKGPDGWRVDGAPLVFFHFSGFDPLRPKVLSKHQNRLAVEGGSALAELLSDFAKAMLKNGHEQATQIPYAHNSFEGGRKVSPLMRRKALRAGRAGEMFPGGLGAATSAWFDAVDPEMTEPGLPDITRLMEQVWHENPGADPFDPGALEGRLGFHQWFVDNAEVLGADGQAVEAAQRLAKHTGGSARAAEPQAWSEAPWSGPAAQVFDWVREATEGTPRACLALLAGRNDLRQRFGDDPQKLLAWCLGPEAAAGRFAADLLPAATIAALAEDSRSLFEAARLAERTPSPTELRRRLAPGFGAGERAGWPEVLTKPLREPYLARAKGYRAPFVRLFLEIWESRPDLQRLFPLKTPTSRLRYLRWLLGGGLAEYGVEVTALPPRVINHPLMRLAKASLRGRQALVTPLPAAKAAGLVVCADAAELAAGLPSGWLAYDPSANRFMGPGGPSTAPAHVDQVCFLSQPGLLSADAIALHAHGVSWSRAAAVWSNATLETISPDTPAMGFVDEVWTPAGDGPELSRPARTLDPKSPLDAALAPALAVLMNGFSAAQGLWRRAAPRSVRRLAAPVLMRGASAYVHAAGRPRHVSVPGLPIKVVGLFSAASGIAASARLAVRAFEALGLPVETIEASAGGLDFRRRLKAPQTASAWIFHLNPPELIATLASFGPHQVVGPRYGLWAWELPRAPRDWLRAGALVDEIWAPSHYTAEALAGAPAPVRVVPHPLFIEDYAGVRPAARSAAFEVVSLFDFNSSVARKNPFGAIAAFRRAFGDDPDCRLTLKTQNGDKFPELMRGLQAQCGANVRILDAAWPYAEVKALIAGADALISLHRAEGFGLTLAEAMAMGVPVISTAFSGSTDFMDEGAALLTPYRLIAVEDAQAIYRDQVWAEPDIDVAAGSLKRLRAEPALRARLGAAGRAMVAERLSPEAWLKSLPQAVQDAALRLSGR